MSGADAWSPGGLWGRYGQLSDGRIHPLVPGLDEHDRDVIDNRVLPAAIGLLTNQPAIVDEFQTTRVIASPPSGTRYTMWTTEYRKQLF